MKNYVIINGTNSNTINGLGINELPPITKPQLRVLTEEIDGRDGDITTPLGYSAYDKTFTIGLFGEGYDINDVISFFNASGTIVFSNEPDKYYNFKTISQIDYESLLKFKSASITIHCQPFKYPTEETPLEIEYQQVTGTGESITLDHTANAPMQLDLKGNTSQDTTTGKNLLNPIGTSSSQADITLTNNGDGTFTANGTASEAVNFSLTNLSTSPITLEANTTYTQTLEIISGTFGGSIVPAFKNSGGTITYNYFNCNSNSRTDSKTPTEKMTAYSYNLYLGSGVSITNCKFRVQLEKGNSTSYEQYTGGIPAPNPSYPETIHSVSGDNIIEVCGKNLFDKNNAKYLIGYIDTNTIVSYSTYRTIYIKCKPNTKYSISRGLGTSQIYMAYTNTTPILNGSCYGKITGTTITTGNDAEYLLAQVYRSNTDTNTFEEILGSIMINEGETALPYEAYTGQTLPINLPSGMELNKIGTYQDYFYKDSGKWYKHEEIGKVVLNGSEAISDSGYNASAHHYTYSGASKLGGQTNLLSNKFYVSTVGTDVYSCIGNANNTNITMKMPLTITTTTEMKTWLSSNNTTFYFVLLAPTNTEITDTTLINQLEALKSAYSYNTQTNISQTNDDLPFIISASAIKKGTNEVEIENIGNYYARPTLDIKGTGNVSIYKDNNQILQVDLSTNNEIVIENMEAYEPSTNQLMNRKVIGNYDNITTPSGTCIYKVSGDLTKMTITGYTRWL